jgi:regulator of protease activity HflC (stomatin/prohibitin superfamily)
MVMLPLLSILPRSRTELPVDPKANHGPARPKNKRSQKEGPLRPEEDGLAQFAIREAVAAVADIDAWLYRLVQFAIRETVASRTLDEVLSAKTVLDAELRAYVRERVADTGIEVMELGVKDVILPGEIRELVNKVVEAERTARANLIRRQEETAATRSLLNTAKLMEDNPLLLRLKELESLERLVEKVGRIDLHAGEGRGLDALLTGLVRMKADGPA